jgi:glycosyltransferase involved in cell wall biosynthesis
MRKDWNVLQFMSYKAPYRGNFISSLLRLEARIKAEGLEVVYLFQDKEASKRQWVQELIAEGKNIYFLTGKKAKDLSIIYKILIKYKIKIIHTHFAGLKYHFFFNILRKIIKRKLFLISHLRNHYEKKHFIQRHLTKVATDIDLYIGVSRSVSEHHRRINNIEEKKITYVENGIDFTRLDKFKHLEKTEFSIKSTTKIFLMFGFDYYRKGVDLAIEVFNEIINEKTDVCLLISLSSNREYVLSKIRERFNTIPDWIKILEPRNDIATYYHFSDAFLSPSRSEGFCNSLAEAAYCEIPLIASKIPNEDYLYIPTFFEFKSGDLSDLKRQLLTVLSLSEERKIEIGKNQKDYVIKTFDLNKWAEQIFAIYKSFDSSNNWSHSL